MQIVAHRVNTVIALKNTPNNLGVEVDIRSWGKQLIVQHEPFVTGEDLSQWLKEYKHRLLVLNIKEEGIENCVKSIVESQGIQDYFFLDLSFPFLIKIVNSGEKRVALRFSEFESIETVLALKGKADWVWVDSFSSIPLTENNFKLLNKHFKIALASPELHSDKIEAISKAKTQLKGLAIDAVCTKRPDLWAEMSNK